MMISRAMVSALLAGGLPVLPAFGALWGNAIPIPAAASYGNIGAVDVACPSATETNVVTTGALVALNNGAYYPEIWGVLAILLGATAPSALVCAFRLGAGADVDTYTVPPALLTNAATLMVQINLVGVNSASAWVGAGSTINVTINPTGQAVTCKAVGTKVVVALNRGPDL